MTLQNIFNGLNDKGLFIFDFMNTVHVLEHLVANEEVQKRRGKVAEQVNRMHNPRPYQAPRISIQERDELGELWHVLAC